jgi:hypothetical protein
MFDANCDAEAGMVDVLSRTAVLTGRLVQALDLTDSPESSGFWRIDSRVCFVGQEPAPNTDDEPRGLTGVVNPNGPSVSVGTDL